ncbi:MAG: single-stranded DNA-binding protein [Oscillospiraceae bacterium]|nr:single-stranded DNA-binding protein [Oscillospiraceae bacterium]
MNKVNLVGRITADPKIDMIEGKKQTRFTVAIRRKFSKNKKNDIDYISCVAKGHNAEFIEQHFTKGNNIVIVGEIRTKKYKSGGRINYSTSIFVEEVDFVRSDEDFKANERS